MRYNDIKLVEYTDLNRAKQQIISTISGLDARNQKEAEILDRIWRVLNTNDSGEKINTAFSATLGDEKFSKQERNLIIRNLTEILGNLSADYTSMNKFLDKLEKSGGVVNLNALSTPLSSFEQVFDGDSVAMQAFVALANYGSGRKQKGPGEYALAMLSNKIRLAAGEGDLEIEGIGKVELKAAISSSGGRIGYGGGSQKAKRAVLDKYAERIPTVISRLGGIGGSIGLGGFIQSLNQDLPVADAENKKIREAIASELLTMDLEQFAAPVIQAFATTEDINKIEDEYLIANFTWYKDRDDFDALLLCSFPNRKFAMIRDKNDLLAFKASGHANSRSISIVPTQAGAGREQWAQLTLNRAKVG